MSDRKERSDKGTFKDSKRSQPDVVVTFRLSPGHEDYPFDQEVVDYITTFSSAERRAMLTEAVRMHKFQNVTLPEPQPQQVEDVIAELRDLIDRILSADLQPATGTKKKKKDSGVDMGYLSSMLQMIKKGDDGE